ncbi:MAG: hypothetical protein V3S36_00060 [Acidiferrobacterales bacterium]|jgi:hypothetical protein
MYPTFDLPIPEGQARRLAIGWLTLGVAALVASGLFAVLLVLSRTPHVQQIIPGTDFFHTALVAHVVLSVLIWLLAFAGMLWSLNRVAGREPLALGTAIIAAAPFVGAANPLINNYVPVLQHPWFFGGLIIFAAGYSLQITVTLLARVPRNKVLQGVDALRFGIWTSAIAAALAMGAFTWSYLGIPRTVVGQGYYEYLFWGGGHVLQFTHTLLMLVA